MSSKLGAVSFDYSNKNWITAMQEPGGVDAVFDPLGFESFDERFVFDCIVHPPIAKRLQTIQALGTGLSTLPSPQYSKHGNQGH